MPEPKPDRRRTRTYEEGLSQTLAARSRTHEVATLRKVAELRRCGWTVTPPTPNTAICDKCRYTVSRDRREHHDSEYA